MVEAFLQALVSLFAMVDPIAGAALFVTLTVNNTPGERRRMARRAALTTFLVLAFFLGFGAWLFALFAVTMSAFRIAGGLVIGFMTLDLLKVTHTGIRATVQEETEAIAKEDISITPLAVPMLAGPGAISTVMILASRHDGLIVLAAILLVALATWLFLHQAARIIGWLGQTGINVIQRLMGLVVLAVAVQFVQDGVLELVPAIRQAWG